MTDVNSPILDFYPQEFEQDLNGKKQDWEAVVKIPFIDQRRLLRAMGGELSIFFSCVYPRHTSYSKGTSANGRRAKT